MISTSKILSRHSAIRPYTFQGPVANVILSESGKFQLSSDLMTVLVTFLALKNYVILVWQQS